MISQGSGNKTDQPIFSRCGGAAFCRANIRESASEPGPIRCCICRTRRHRRRLPPGDARRRERAEQLAAESIRRPRDRYPDRPVRNGFRMQTSVPELTDLSGESQETLDMYGIKDDGVDGGYARNCLLARRMAERGVRFVQLMHRGWDQHGSLPTQIRGQCRDVDQPSAALVADLKDRGLLDETLVIWGGEFGRTVYSQGALTATNYGRDHHGRCFTLWMAGGGIKPGILRRDRRLLLQRGPGRRPCPRLPGHRAPVPGDRPRTADLPLPRPRLPPDRCAWERGTGDFGLRRLR
jgi:hypothetical protein